MNAQATRWSDLRTRLLSALVMMAVGAAEIWLGGLWFLALLAVLVGVMTWELARLSDRNGPLRAFGLAGLAGLCLILDEGWPSVSAWLLFPLVPLAFLALPRRHPVVTALFALAIMVTGHGLFVLRDDVGTPAILWLLGVVIASDVAGYFVGRLVGGPKFWPAISPKKTWSGTVAGWGAAALVGLGFWLGGHGSAALIAASALVALAGQMGDIAESWIKRQAGVKDASSLIPGHGGVLDRFDALIGAVVAVMVLQLFWPVAPALGG